MLLELEDEEVRGEELEEELELLYEERELLLLLLLLFCLGANEGLLAFELDSYVLPWLRGEDDELLFDCAAAEIAKHNIIADNKIIIFFISFFAGYIPSARRFL